MKLMLSANKVQDLCHKIEDVIKVKGKYESLYIHKDEHGIWHGEMIYAKRNVYIGLERNENTIVV